MLINIYIITSIILNTLLLIFFFSICKYISIYDSPINKLKTHKKKILSTGWLFTFFSLVGYFLIIIFDKDLIFKDLLISSYFELYVFLFGFFSFFLVGLLDDLNKLGVSERLIFIILTVLIIINLDKNLIISTFDLNLFNLTISFDFFHSYVFTILCALTLVNMFNFFDGINLQIGTYFFISFLSLFVHLNEYNLLLLTILFSLLPFLYLNFKNKAFIGNTGIYIISYLFFYIICKNYVVLKSINVDLLILIFFVPFTDMVRLIISRIINKKNPLKGDLNHLHHRLLKVYGFKKSICLSSLILILPIFMFFYLNFSTNFILFLQMLLYFQLIYVTKKVS